MLHTSLGAAAYLKLVSCSRHKQRGAGLLARHLLGRSQLRAAHATERRRLDLHQENCRTGPQVVPVPEVNLLAGVAQVVATYRATRLRLHIQATTTAISRRILIKALGGLLRARAQASRASAS